VERVAAFLIIATMPYDAPETANPVAHGAEASSAHDGSDSFAGSVLGGGSPPSGTFAARLGRSHDLVVSTTLVAPPRAPRLCGSARSLVKSALTTWRLHLLCVVWLDHSRAHAGNLRVTGYITYRSRSWDSPTLSLFNPPYHSFFSRLPYTVDITCSPGS